MGAPQQPRTSPTAVLGAGGAAQLRAGGLLVLLPASPRGTGQKNSELGLESCLCHHHQPLATPLHARCSPEMQGTSPAGRAMPWSPWLLSALATSPLHRCVVNQNNLQVVRSRQSDPRDSSHRRGFVSKATSCLLAAKGHGNEGSLWKMNSSVTTTTNICRGAYREGRERGVSLGGAGKSQEWLHGAGEWTGCDLSPEKPGPAPIEMHSAASIAFMGAGELAQISYSFLSPFLSYSV